MRYRVISAKTALSSSGLPGLDYSLNPYRGCEHGCVYCYAPGILRMDRAHWGESVEVRQNLPLVLARELKRKPRGVIGVSTVTDPYQQCERRFCITRYCLEQIACSDWPVSIQTRSDLILRDVEVLKQCSSLEIMLSIGSLNEKMVGVWEPSAPSVKRRLEAVRKLRDHDLKTGVFFGPIYPMDEEKDIKAAVEAFAGVGVSFLMVDDLHLKPGVYAALSETVPSLMRSEIGKAIDQRMSGKELKRCVQEYASEYGIPVLNAFD